MEINNIKYEIIKDEKEALDVELLNEKITDYFDTFDYIVGDWAYGKLRLKGFNDITSKTYKKHNDIKNVEKYINDKCAYGCKYFIIKKLAKIK